MIYYLKDRRRYYKNGGLIRRMKDASGGPIHYSRTMTSDNLSKAANYVGGYILKGLGALGKIFTAPLTGGPLGPATVVLPKTKKLLDAERKLRETQEELIGKAMTWVSPLNYGAALATGNGLNARKGEEEVASWSPAWLAAARLGELYVGPKAVKGVKATPRVVVNTAAKAGVKPAKAAVVAREIKLATKKGVQSLKKLQPKVRTRYGDIEIDNPLLAYRLGNGIIEDFLKTGKVRTPDQEGYGDIIVDDPKLGRFNFGKDFDEPMFALGRLWYGLPRTNTGDLLVTAEPLALANKYSSRIKSSTNGTLDVRYAGFDNGRIRSRRVLTHEGLLTPETTTAYRWVPGYGYKKVIQEPSTSLKFFERKPFNSKLKKSEEAGVPKGERNQPLPSFRSELDWTPEGWFEKTAGRKYKDGSLTQYTDEDIKELISHIPEYLEIEARSKKNGTWLKMEDGSNWYGDSRSWVLMLSKNLKLHNPEDFWTGVHNSENFLEINSVNPEYNGKIWGVYGQKLLSAAKARTYAPNDNLVFHMVSSKKTPTVVYDALGRPWYDIGGLKVGDQYIAGRTTDEVINDNFSKGIGRVKINDVSDTGPNKIKTNSKYSTGDFMLDWETLNSPGVHQNDIILSPGSFRKSLLGNNGAFSYKNKNIYRGLIPLTTGYTLYNLFNQPKQQLQYLKQGGKINAIEQFKQGSKIHIKKKNRGKFTAYCGGNVTSACIAKAKASGNPTLVKRATFAANARKWKHLNGGIIKAKTGLSTSSFIDPMIVDYIKAIENPNRVGWNGKIWKAPELKGYDLNLRGYGIDINTNNAAKKLTAGRQGQWLTDDEANTLMLDHIRYIMNAANKHIKGFGELPIGRKAALLGMLYRGDSVNKSNINITEPDDTKFFNSVHNYYISKGLKERANNSSKFFKSYGNSNTLNFNFNNYKDLNYPFKYIQ